MLTYSYSEGDKHFKTGSGSFRGVVANAQDNRVVSEFEPK